MSADLAGEGVFFSEGSPGLQGCPECDVQGLFRDAAGFSGVQCPDDCPTEVGRIGGNRERGKAGGLSCDLKEEDECQQGQTAEDSEDGAFQECGGGNQSEGEEEG